MSKFHVSDGTNFIQYNPETTIAKVVGLQTALNNKSNTGHTHAAADVTTGSFHVDRIPNLNASKITAGSLNVDRIPNLDAGKVTTGVFDIARIPAAALERLVEVANQTARFALTTASVQTGDTVKQTDTNVMYRVVDDTKLNQAAGYTEYVAGRAAEVPWAGVTDKPTVFPPEAHTHSIANVTSLQGELDGKVPTTRTITINGTAQSLASNRSWSVGTVTSVALSLPNIFTVSGSPINSSGTISATLASQSANRVFAAPSGSAGAPTFRALVANDIPALATSKITGLDTALANKNKVTVNATAPSGAIAGDVWIQP